MKTSIVKLFKFIIAILIVGLALLLILAIGIQIPYFQNKLVQIATSRLSEAIGTKVEVGNVSIDFLTHIHLNDLMIKDYKNDTLIFVETLDNHHSFDLAFNKPFRLNDKKLTITGVKLYLDNTVKDSVFNITKTFSENKNKSNSNNKTDVSPKQNKTNLDFLKLGEINLNKVEFRLKDHYNYQTISFKIQSLELDALPLKIADSPWILNKLLVHSPFVTIIHHPSPSKLKDYDPDYLHLPFNINLAKLKLDHARFRIYDEPLSLNRNKNVLSFADLDATDIFIDVENVKLRTPSIQGKVLHFSAKEKSGLEIQDIRTDFFLNSYKTEAKDLVFKTNYSTMNGYLRFDYKHMRQYLRFAEWVKVTARMKNSQLSLKDLAYFTPTLEPWKHLDIKFNTLGSGTMNNLWLSNLEATLHQNRLNLNGNMRVLDLFNGKGLHVLADLNQVNFDKKDIEFVFQKPNLPTEVERLGKINYKGSFAGNPTKFVLNGKLSNSNGNAELKETVFDLSDKNSPTYKGNIILDDFKLAHILTKGNPIDRISANLILDGKGFNIHTLNSSIKGNIKQINIQNATYQNIDIDGNIVDKLFSGNIKSKDPSLRFDADGKLSMKEEDPNIELNIALKDIDLKKLGYTKKPLLFNSHMFAIGRGKNIDEMLGTMLLKDMYILDMSQEGKRYNFSDLTLEKDVFEEGDKYIDVNSDEIRASLIGKYKVSEIPHLLRDYLISYIAIEPNRKNQIFNQSYFNLNLDLKNIRSYSKLFHEELKNIERGELNLRFDGTTNKMKINGKLFNTEYLQFKIPHIVINNESSNTSFFAKLDFDSIYFQNKLAITPMKALISQLPEGIKLSVELLNREDDKFVDFNTLIKKNGSEYGFHILPFTSYFGKKVWSVHPDNEIKINTASQSLTVSDLELYKDRQVIKISNKSDDSSTLHTVFQQVKLEELISGFLPILKSFKGNLNGEIDIANILKNPTPIANLDVGNIEFDNEKIGNLILKSDFKDEMLQSNFSLVGEKVDLKAEGIFNARSGIDSLYARTSINKIDLAFLNKYLKDLIYNMEGNVRGNVNFYGKLTALQAEGLLFLDSLKTVINTIHTKYYTKNQTITITPGKFVLSDFKFIDEEGNEGMADGFIAHNHFKQFNLFLNAESPKLLCMNTNATHNAYFYGKVYADAKVQFRGTIGDRISISSQGKNLPNSELTIAFGNSQRTDKYSFYEFVKKDSIPLENIVSKGRKKSGGVNLDFDFDVNSFGKLYILMDPSVDDKIECTGNGKIQFDMTPETDMSIKGSYEINSGSYLFTYQNLVQRVFYLERGGKMTFVGPPRSSLIDATAKFTTRASAQELISAYFGNTDDPRVLSAAKTSVKVNIFLKLKEKITQPKISYELDVEQNNPEVLSAFESIKSTTKNNEAELNKQVVGLLVFQRFFPPSSGFSNANQSSNTVSSDLQNTALDVVTGKISGYITDWIQNTFRGMNFDLKLRGYNQSDKVAKISDTRNELKFAVSQKLLNDRLVFNLGGNYDFGRNQQSNSNTSFFGGDVDIEYLISPQGNIRAKIYSTLSNDPLNSVYINKTGMGILFQKEFDNFNQLFKKTK